MNRIHFAVFVSLLFAASLHAQTPSASPLPIETFRNNCSVCHGDNGEGGAGPQLKPLPIPAKEVRIVVREGRGQMPSFAPSQIADSTLEALLVFLEKWK
jgi:hypothetical protein